MLLYPVTNLLNYNSQLSQVNNESHRNKEILDTVE